MEKRKVIIFGGGIGGLSCAHELSKRSNEFEITIIERNNHLGGQAAETTTKTGDHTALCWHAVSKNYKYFLDIMNEIIDKDGIKVISHLKPISRFIYGLEDSNCAEYKNSFITTGFKDFSAGFENIYKRKPPRKDMIKFFFIYLYVLAMCDERVESYDNILWKDYVRDFSPDVKRWILDSTSIYLGMEYNKLSTHFMFDLIRKSDKKTRLDSQYAFYSFDESMEKVLFKPWKAYLEDKGVSFLFNHEITKIYHIPNLTTISSIDVIHNGITTTHTANIFINSLDVKSLANLHPIPNTYFDELYNNSRQIQTQVLYYLPYRLQDIRTEPTILILPNTQWFLMVKIEGDIWQTTGFDLLSCGIGIWDTPGINGKPAINCTREEIAQECWNQINASQHNLELKSLALPKWDIWNSFQFNFDKLELDTFEPKFSNNVNTLHLRPNFNDKFIQNLYHATSYTRNETNIYNMESAAESGVKVANLIFEKYPIVDNSIRSDPIESDPIEKKIKTVKKFRFIRTLDRYLFNIKKFFTI